MILEQLAAAPPAVDHAKELAAAAVIFMTQIGSLIASHLKGKKRDRTLSGEMDKRFAPLRAALEEMSDQVRDLKAFVIGPDGQNGLRGEVREIKKELREIHRGRSDTETTEG